MFVNVPPVNVDVGVGDGLLAVENTLFDSSCLTSWNCGVLYSLACCFCFILPCLLLSLIIMQQKKPAIPRGTASLYHNSHNEVRGYFTPPLISVSRCVLMIFMNISGKPPVVARIICRIYINFCNSPNAGGS